MSRTETTAASHHETSRGLLRSGGAATFANLVRTLALLATHLVVRRFVPPDEWAVWNWLEAVFLVLATVRDAGFPSHAVRLRPIPFGNLLRAEAGMGAAITCPSNSWPTTSRAISTCPGSEIRRCWRAQSATDALCLLGNATASPMPRATTNPRPAIAASEAARL